MSHREPKRVPPRWPLTDGLVKFASAPTKRLRQRITPARQRRKAESRSQKTLRPAPSAPKVRGRKPTRERRGDPRPMTSNSTHEGRRKQFRVASFKFKVSGLRFQVSNMSHPSLTCFCLPSSAAGKRAANGSAHSRLTQLNMFHRRSSAANTRVTRFRFTIHDSRPAGTTYRSPLSP